MAIRARWLGESYKTESYDESTRQTVLGDEPERIGGTNTGPSPLSLLPTSLANCSIGAMLRVARDENIALDGLEVDVAYKLNRLDEGVNSHYTVTCDLRMTEMRQQIRAIGDISDEQADALLWGAAHCPVSNTIEGGVPVKRAIEVVRPREARTSSRA